LKNDNRHLIRTFLSYLESAEKVPSALDISRQSEDVY